jgi:hypothetical protein
MKLKIPTGMFRARLFDGTTSLLANVVHSYDWRQ